MWHGEITHTMGLLIVPRRTMNRLRLKCCTPTESVPSANQQPRAGEGLKRHLSPRNPDPKVICDPYYGPEQRHRLHGIDNSKIVSPQQLEIVSCKPVRDA